MYHILYSVAMAMYCIIYSTQCSPAIYRLFVHSTSPLHVCLRCPWDQRTLICLWSLHWILATEQKLSISFQPKVGWLGKHMFVWSFVLAMHSIWWCLHHYCVLQLLPYLCYFVLFHLNGDWIVQWGCCSPALCRQQAACQAAVAVVLHSVDSKQHVRLQ